MNFTFIKYVYMFYETLMIASKVNLLWFGDFNNNFLIFPPVRSRSCRWKALYLYKMFPFSILCSPFWFCFWECCDMNVCTALYRARMLSGELHTPGLASWIVIIIIIIIIPGVMDGPTGKVNVHTRVIAHLSENKVIIYYLDIFGSNRS